MSGWRVLADVKGASTRAPRLVARWRRTQETFSNIYVNMVRAGEGSGALDVVLERLADFTEGKAGSSPR